MMNARGFFSVFVGVLAIALLISVLYTQAARYDTQFRAEELSVVHQEVSKDWFLARNVLTNFASDAILYHVESQVTAPAISCSDSITLNFAPVVESYWDQATLYMKTQYGVNCDANLSYQLQNSLDNLALSAPQVLDNQRAYGILSCTRSSASGFQTITHPFVIRKDVRTASTIPVGCDVNVFDTLGSTTANPFSKQDVNKHVT